MAHTSSRAKIFLLIGLAFLIVSSVYSQTAEEYFKRGLVYYTQGNFPQAITELTKTIEINPNDAMAYYGRGLAYFNQANYPQAISDYTKAIEINPSFMEAYNNRGVAYFFQKDFTRAWEDVHKAQELGFQVNPDFIENLKKSSGKET